MRRRQFLRSGASLSAFTRAAVFQEEETPRTLDQRGASAQGGAAKRVLISRDELLGRALRGCDWMADISQVKDKTNPFYGAMKGEYDTRSRKWRFYGPFWHTGQAVRALLLAYDLKRDEKYLNHAVLGGEYMIRYQAMDKTDGKYYGFIDGKQAESTNTASQLEGFCALLDLYRVTADKRWRERFKLALDWVVKNLYLAPEGLFLNMFYASKYAFDTRAKARPLNDDAAFYHAYRELNKPAYLQIFREVSDRLLREEDPPGNFMKYAPCKPSAFGGEGHIHPRHAWWWGYPMLTAYDAFKEEKYLKAGIRACDWYLDNVSLDGACYYHNSLKGRHLSFDFCTSAVGCAVIMWVDLWKRTRQEKYRNAIEASLGFLLKAQFRQDVPDRNIRGAFFEGLYVPDGTMNQGYYFRDIATIFSARAMLEVLKAFDGQPLHYVEY